MQNQSKREITFDTIENRSNITLSFQATRCPRELFKRNSDGGVRTGDAAPSDIKPEVLG